MAAVGILGLAIGITTTMFTVVDALMRGVNYYCRRQI